MRVLGIDLGTKRIGVAVSDFTGSVASPLTVVHRGKSKRADHDAIARIVRDEEAEAVVVGLPLNMDGSRGSAAKAAVAEAEQINEQPGGGWVIGDREYYLDYAAGAAHRPQIQTRGGRQQLVVRLTNATLNEPLSYRLFW